MIDEMGMEARITYEPVVQQGNYVIRQTPDSGVEVKKGDVADIVVSQGEDIQGMPQVTGMTREAALKALSDAGLATPTIVVDESVSGESEEVIRQTPEAGEPVRQGDDIILYVNAVTRTTVAGVPNLAGKYVSDAVKEAYDAGFSKVFVYRSAMGEQPGVVLSQEPVSSDSGELPGETMRLTMEYLGAPNYVGTFHVDQALFDQGASIQLTIQEMIDEQICEFVVFEAVVENVDEFVERYGASVDFSVYLPVTADTVKRQLTVYHDGQMAAVSEITLTKKES